MSNTNTVIHTAEIKFGDYSVVSSRKECMALAIKSAVTGGTYAIRSANLGSLHYELLYEDVSIDSSNGSVAIDEGTDRKHLLDLCTKIRDSVSGGSNDYEKALENAINRGIFIKMCKSGRTGSYRKGMFSAWAEVGNSVFGLPISDSPEEFYSTPLEMDPNDYSWFQYLKAWWYRAPLLDTRFIPYFLIYMEKSSGDFALSFCCAYAKMKNIYSNYALSFSARTGTDLLRMYGLYDFEKIKKQPMFLNKTVRRMVYSTLLARFSWGDADHISFNLTRDLDKNCLERVDAARISALKVLLEMRAGNFGKVGRKTREQFISKVMPFCETKVSFRHIDNYRLEESIDTIIDSSVKNEFQDRGVVVPEKHFLNEKFVNAVNLSPRKAIQALVEEGCSYKFSGE